jgi:hypothetical protein
MHFRLLHLVLLLFSCLAIAEEDFAVIGYPGLPKTDRQGLQRLYTGRSLSLGATLAVPINLPGGHPQREQFLQAVLGQSEEQYTGYWLVRRYVGKGAPPRELATVDEVVRFVAETPGAVGYVPLSKVPSGGNVIFRR